MPSPLDTADLRRRVQACLDAELARQAGVLAELGPDVDDLLSAVADLLRGGKRLRAAFLYWGHRAAGRPDSDALVRLASAMELFQAAALIHDDVMDDSDTRRGHAGRAPRARDPPRRARLGRRRRPLRPRRGRARRQPLPHLDRRGLRDERHRRPTTSPGAGQVFDRMRTQLMAGQFLDVVESMRPWHGLPDAERVERAGRVIRYKSAKYSVEHPLLIGATTGGLDAAGPRRALALRPRPRPRLPAARRPARRVRRPRADGQARGRRPARGQAHRPPRPRARRLRRAPTADGSRPSSAAPTSTPPRSTSCGASSRVRARSGCSRTRSAGSPRPRGRPLRRAPRRSTPSAREALLDLVDVATARTA